jgi:ribosome maturation factor RimP
MTTTRPKSGSSPRTRRPAEITARVGPIAGELAMTHGLVVWSVSFTRTAGRDILRVAADRVGGIVSDELALFAEDLGRSLDHADAVVGSAPYVLEVTSPGAERRLETPEQFRVCRGRVARLKFKDGRPALDGVIADVDSEAVSIETQEGAEHVPLAEIARAQLRVTEIG